MCVCRPHGCARQLWPLQPGQHLFHERWHPVSGQLPPAAEAFLRAVPADRRPAQHADRCLLPAVVQDVEWEVQPCSAATLQRYAGLLPPSVSGLQTGGGSVCVCVRACVCVCVCVCECMCVCV